MHSATCIVGSGADHVRFSPCSIQTLIVSFNGQKRNEVWKQITRGPGWPQKFKAITFM